MRALQQQHRAELRPGRYRAKSRPLPIVPRLRLPQRGGAGLTTICSRVDAGSVEGSASPQTSEAGPADDNGALHKLSESQIEPEGALKDAAEPAVAPAQAATPAKSSWMGRIPHRWRLVWLMSAAFLLGNMDKVNMSVAVIPMAHDLGWSATDRGLVSSSFFWGYSLTQVPAGWISTKIGGARVLMAGVALWSFGTLIAPPAARLGLWALCASRALVGLGEGFAPSAATSVLARTVPSGERSRAVTTVWGGLDVGSAVGLLLSGPLIRMYGWPSVFYLFALLGGVWCLVWPLFRPDDDDPESVAEQQRSGAAGGGGGAGAGGVVRVPRLPSMGADASSSAAASEAILDARIAAGSMDEFDGDEDARAVPLAGLNSNGRQWLQQQQRQQQQQQAAASGINSSSSAGDGGTSTSSTQQQQQDQQNAAAAAGTSSSSSTPQQQQQQKQADTQVPWGAFLRSPPVWAVTVAHFCFNWGYYTLLAWLPSYFELALGLNVQESSFLTLIPYVAMVLMTPVVGPIADGLTKRGWRLTTVRKLAQGIAFVGPAACMVAVALLTPAAPGGAAGLQTAALVALLSLGFALGAWSRAGLYCNHQDLSPKYASALLGITNTAGALPGVLGVTSAGYLLDATGSWPLALFLPTAACQLFGAVFYALFASSERQPWS